MVTVENIKQILFDIAVEVERQKDYFSQLDREIGDGDHGITMSLGWQAIREKLEETPDVEDGAQLCKLAGMAFLNAVGSSVGPLYATFFLRGGMALQGKKEFEDNDIYQFIVKGVEGIKERGKAEIGDKTMIDMWEPAVESLKEVYKNEENLFEALDAAVAAGEKGMKATANMESKKGRSSRLGERSIGHQDPGATSAFTVLSTFVSSLKKLADRKDI